MIHAIIFDNRQAEIGYNLYESTPDFPTAYRSEILEVCKLFRMNGSDSSTIRYAPVLDRYLLSVSVRLPEGSVSQDRGHFYTINLLFERKDAEQFFSIPFCAEIIVQFAVHCYNSKLADFNLDWEAYQNQSLLYTQDQTAISLSLKEALLYPYVSVNKSSQLFVGLNPADPAIRQLQKLLPPRLLPEMTFLIGPTTLGETNGVTTVFGDPAVIKSLTDSGSADGVKTAKVFCLPGSNSTWVLSGATNPASKDTARALNTRISDQHYTWLKNAITTRDLFCKLGNTKRNMEFSDMLVVLAEENPVALVTALNAAKLDQNAITDLQSSIPKMKKSKFISNKSGVQEQAKKLSATLAKKKQELQRQNIESNGSTNRAGMVYQTFSGNQSNTYHSGANQFAGSQNNAYYDGANQSAGNLNNAYYDGTNQSAEKPNNAYYNGVSQSAGNQDGTYHGDPSQFTGNRSNAPRGSQSNGNRNNAPRDGQSTGNRNNAPRDGQSTGNRNNAPRDGQSAGNQNGAPNNGQHTGKKNRPQQPSMARYLPLAAAIALILSVACMLLLIMNHFERLVALNDPSSIVITSRALYSMVELVAAFLAGGFVFISLPVLFRWLRS